MRTTQKNRLLRSKFIPLVENLTNLDSEGDEFISESNYKAPAEDLNIDQ
jgi:hypothetical protein